LAAIKGTVQSVESARGRITTVRAGDRAIRGDSFILATGHHIGGGIEGGRIAREPLLNLGVFHEGEPVGRAGTRLQHLQYIDALEALRSGLRADNHLHPLDDEGQVPYANLFAAGAILGGYDYAGACGFGVPILTGWLAGRWAARSSN
jgi:glycerol-3-phosphate dehydrogenase subunit B